MVTIFKRIQCFRKSNLVYFNVSILAKQKKMSKKLLIIVNELSYFISHRLNVAIEAKKGYLVYICYGENKLKKNSSKIINDFKFFHVSIKRGNLNPIN